MTRKRQRATKEGTQTTMKSQEKTAAPVQERGRKGRGKQQERLKRKRIRVQSDGVKMAGGKWFSEFLGVYVGGFELFMLVDGGVNVDRGGMTAVRQRHVTHDKWSVVVDVEVNAQTSVVLVALTALVVGVAGVGEVGNVDLEDEVLEVHDDDVVEGVDIVDRERANIVCKHRRQRWRRVSLLPKGIDGVSWQVEGCSELIVSDVDGPVDILNSCVAVVGRFLSGQHMSESGLCKWWKPWVDLTAMRQSALWCQTKRDGSISEGGESSVVFVEEPVRACGMVCVVVIVVGGRTESPGRDVVLDVEVVVVRVGGVLVLILLEVDVLLGEFVDVDLVDVYWRGEKWRSRR
eukprot:1506150-Amphidinium_carterae.1